MADNQESRLAQAQGRTANRRAVQGGAEAMQDTARLMDETGNAAAEIARDGGATTAATMRHLGDAFGEALRGNVRNMAGTQNKMLEEGIGNFEESVSRIAQVIQNSARDWRALMQLPGTTGGGIQDVAGTFNDAVGRVMHVNLQTMQDLFRMTGPAAMAELHQRFLRSYLDAVLEGSTAVVRAIRESAEQTLRPLEQRLEQRQPQPEKGNGKGSERVADVMHREVKLANPEDNVQDAARIMRESDVGLLPVGEGDRLVGMVTDRDLATRLVAEGRHPAHTKVREVMSSEVRYVFEDEDLEHVAENMAEQQVRRLPVMNREKRLVGVVSLGDIAKGRQAHLAGKALHGVAREGGQHRQAAE